MFLAAPLVSLSATKTHTLLVLGDSLSAAYNMPTDQGWVSLLQAKLDDQKIPVNVVNASVSGATTAAGLQLLPTVLNEHQPRFVIIELGANDGLQGKPLDYIRGNLEKLIQLSKNSNADVMLLGVRIPPNYGDAYAVPFFTQFSELADEFRVAHVPFFLDGVAGVPQLMMPDGLHPRAEAQPMILENVWPEIVNVFERSGLFE